MVWYKWFWVKILIRKTKNNISQNEVQRIFKSAMSNIFLVFLGKIKIVKCTSGCSMYAFEVLLLT